MRKQALVMVLVPLLPRLRRLSAACRAAQAYNGRHHQAFRAREPTIPPSRAASASAPRPNATGPAMSWQTGQRLRSRRQVQVQFRRAEPKRGSISTSSPRRSRCRSSRRDLPGRRAYRRERHADYNLSLSERRAQAVVRYLSERGRRRGQARPARLWPDRAAGRRQFPAIIAGSRRGCRWSRGPRPGPTHSVDRGTGTMAALNFADLAKPVSADDPCGPDPDADPDIMNCWRASRWCCRPPISAVTTRGGSSPSTVARSNSRRLSAISARSWNRAATCVASSSRQARLLNRDVAGFAASLGLITSYLGDLSGGGHPRAEDGDFIMREVALQGLDETRPSSCRCSMRRSSRASGWGR